MVNPENLQDFSSFAPTLTFPVCFLNSFVNLNKLEIKQHTHTHTHSCPCRFLRGTIERLRTDVVCSKQGLTQNQCSRAVLIVSFIIDIRDLVENVRTSSLEMKHNDPRLYEAMRCAPAHYAVRE